MDTGLILRDTRTYAESSKFDYICNSLCIWFAVNFYDESGWNKRPSLIGLRVKVLVNKELILYLSVSYGYHLSVQTGCYIPNIELFNVGIWLERNGFFQEIVSITYVLYSAKGYGLVVLASQLLVIGYAGYWPSKWERSHASDNPLPVGCY